MSTASRPALEPRDRIIVALDVPTLDEARAIVDELCNHVGGFKVGLELLTAAGGREVVAMIRSRCARVMYDAKFHDIPATMAGAARSAADLGVWAFTVHASAGPAGVEAAYREKRSSLLLAVTVLTSLGAMATWEIYGRPTAAKVVQLAAFARDAGADGVVCSPWELGVLRGDARFAGLLKVVPGVRPAWANADDQARVMTPGEAVRAGADYLVIGRPITKPPASVGGRMQAVDRIVAEIEGVEP